MVNVPIGIINGFGGTFTTACGYALQKKGHSVSIEAKPPPE